MYKLYINGKEREFPSLKKIVEQMNIFEDGNFSTSTIELIEFLQTREAHVHSGKIKLEISDFQDYKEDALDEISRAIIKIQSLVKRFPKYEKQAKESIEMLKKARSSIKP